MKVSQIVPTFPEVARETLITLGGVLIAAYILSRFPRLSDFVSGQSIRVTDGTGKTLF